MTLLDLLNQDGVRFKRVSGTHGGEYAGPCPSCGGTDRFRVWPAQGDGGRYWCRRCSKSGDAIQYLRSFREMGYFDACYFLGREPRNGRRPMLNDRRARSCGQDLWQPKECTMPGEQWARKAELFLTWAEQQLWSSRGKEARAWLDGRGISEATAKEFRLGWNPQSWFKPRSAWGLPEALKDNGEQKKIWIPQGWVIPMIAGNQVVRLRIRLPQPPAWSPGRRYHLVPGSDTSPLVIPGGPACIVVESELDAILLHQEAGHLATIIALGSAQNRPDPISGAILDETETALISLDTDNAGARESWNWWAKHFPRAKRWPVVRGKDPSEALQNGLDLRAWVLAGVQYQQQPATSSGKLVRTLGLPSYGRRLQNLQIDSFGFL